MAQGFGDQVFVQPGLHLLRQSGGVGPHQFLEV